jgi:site-specific DNA-methyltransferase (adenine-specific)
MVDTFAIRILDYGVKAADQFTVNPRNARLHPQFQRDVLNSALTTIGFIAPVIENRRTGYLVDGHERLWQALAQGDSTPVPYVVVELDEDEEAYALATFDPITNLATYDPQLLAALLSDVPDEWITVDDAATHRLLSDLMAAHPLATNGAGKDAPPQVDKAAELQQVWQVARGDLWTFESQTGRGVHRLLCGDSRNTDDMQRLCVDKVQGVFTSPPYAMQRKEQYGGVPADEYVEWWDALQANVRGVLKDDGSFFVNIKPHCEDGERVLYVFDLVLAMQRTYKWCFIDELYWWRQGFPGDFKNCFKNSIEPIYHFSHNTRIKFRSENVLQEFSPNSTAVNEAYLSKSNSGFYGGNVATVNAMKNAGGARPDNFIYAPIGLTATHGGTFQAATFPVALPDFFIRAYSDVGDTWLDPFMGSGTVFVVAEQNQRLACGMEMKPEYCSVILERMKDMGLTPQRAQP